MNLLNLIGSLSVEVAQSTAHPSATVDHAATAAWSINLTAAMLF